MKEQIIRKLTSRKFWAAVVGFVTAIITVFNIDSVTPEQAKVLIMGFATLIAYIVGEGLVDATNKMKVIEVEDIPVEGDDFDA